MLWLPVLTGVLMLSADAALLMHRQTLMYDAAHDAARHVSLGQKTMEDARSALLARLGNADDYQVSVSSFNGYVTTSVGVPFTEVLPFGGGFAKDGTLTSEVTMWVEKNVY